MIRIGIFGYGNLARGVENAIAKNADMTLAAVFSRRDPASVKIATPNVPVVLADDVHAWKDKIDVLVICAGSATDLPHMTPDLAKHFHVVDSYDNHSNIPVHFANVDAAASESGHVALISCGWDPGMFSVNRLYAEAALPDGASYTFWGRGVSQGHSDAIRRIPGVVDARQYTVPVAEAVDRVRKGENPTLSVRDKHTRECYVVAAEGADKAEIEKAIVTMPAYFADYNTTVTFVTLEELKANHAALPHGGSVIRSGITGWQNENKQVVEYSLKLDSNPEFTGSVLVAFSRAVYRLATRGDKGSKTVFDIAPADLWGGSREDLLAHML
ncbi:MAG: diaminopimelate dehydrogenase [Clostridia bacterium]|nr:diaminopimelate dehydrogenase [Clostridia bacterium]